MRSVAFRGHTKTVPCFMHMWVHSSGMASQTAFFFIVFEAVFEADFYHLFYMEAVFITFTDQNVGSYRTGNLQYTERRPYNKIITVQYTQYCFNVHIRTVQYP